ncbi:MAG: ABC transporter permease [Candidatus Ureaplasma intestinipullorum]|uniref:ABC transporter permease n=1 Tax=Candidatus Ureaplasma intestinipullorum TaxID=2838770 RepID=A0A9E2KXC6_9BACT|nr:ABC transporter permease [Candidatus Ureaplasma intestinipullorum]
MTRFLNFLKKTYIFIILFLIYAPLIIVIFLSFTDPSSKGNINLNFSFNNGENWLMLFQNDEFLNALSNTAIIVIFTVPISTIIATLTCFGIWNAKNVYKNITLGSSKLNMIVPDIITGISLALLFSLTIIPMGVNLGFTTIILAHISFCTPYAILIIYPRMMKMKKNLILASMDLGYSKIYTFFKVIIPFLMPAIISAAAIVFSISFDDFIITKLVGGKISTISTEMYTMAKGIKAWAVTFGAIIVLFIFFLAFLIGIKKYLKERKHSNAFKSKFSKNINKIYKL